MSSAYIPINLRQRVTEQARHRCGYCLSQEAITGFPMEVDHIFPQSLGGLTIEDNLWLACSLCNNHKGIRVAAEDPETAAIVRLFNPRFQSWDKHFSWSDSGIYIIGITAVGRATVKALQLNRHSLVEARKIWVSAGWHPP
ncbi:MAG: HNH endonuclease [bacterium]|nr:HNH endonuclease [bacterium]